MKVQNTNYINRGISKISEVSKMSKKITVKISEDIVKELLSQKNVGESYDDVLRRLLKLKKI